MSLIDKETIEVQEIDFEKLLETNKERIYRICRIYAVSPVEPQDLFQEVVYQIWKSIPSFKGNAALDTWIYRIALNVGMRSKLKLEKSSSRTIRLDSITFKQKLDDSNEGKDEKYEILKQCIGFLNDSDKSIILLYLEERSYRQIADITGLTENHIAVKMKRIRKKLLDCILTKLS